MSDRTKLLFHSNAPWAPTGYGVQTALFAPRLKEAGYDVRISAFYGLEAGPLEWNGIRVLPGIGNTFGGETIPYHVRDFFGSARGGIVFTLMDAWVIDPALAAKLNMVCWVPVDHDPAPPRVRQFLQNSHVVPVAMSRHGERALAEFEPLYCPHAVDVQAYRPMGREMARAKLGLPQDAFIVGMVAANKGNPSRKSFAAVIEAFAEFRRRHKNAVLYLYTHLTGEFSQGVPLPPLLEAAGIPEEAVKYPDPYLIHYLPSPPSQMALLYSAFDVLASPSTGEGFGIPMLEAQSCGTPVVTTAWTAMPEVGKVGWHVKGAKMWTSQNSWQMVPRVKEIVSAFEKCYRLPAEQRRKLSERAREHALSYDVERVFSEHMLPALEAAEERIARREPVSVPAKIAA